MGLFGWISFNFGCLVCNIKIQIHNQVNLFKKICDTCVFADGRKMCYSFLNGL